MIHLSGHGTLQPEPRAKGDSNSDGVERIFLPRDVAKWNGGQGPVPNAILGRELTQWIKPLVEKGASLWVIYDGCHTGGFAREVRRFEPSADEGQATPGVTFLYACQAHEKSIEAKLPEGSPNGKPLGLLTFTLCEILTKSPAPLTYDQLANRIRSRYEAMGRSWPTPFVVGRNRSRLILDDRRDAELADIVVTPEGPGYRVNAGSLRGLRRGDIFVVCPPRGTGRDEMMVGHVRVTDVEAYGARVERCEYTGAPLPRKLPVGGRCQPVYLERGNHRRKVSVATRAASGEVVPEARLDRLRQGLQPCFDRAGPLVECVAHAWPNYRVELASLKSDAVYLVEMAPQRGLFDDGPALLRRGPFEGEKGLERLGRLLAGLACERNLLGLAGLSQEQFESGRGLDVELELTVPNAVGAGPKVLVERAGEPLAVTIRNNSRSAIDVTLLLCKDGERSAFFPLGREVNRVPPGKSLTTTRLKAGKIYGETERLLMIAVAADGGPVSYEFLTCPTLGAARERASAEGIAERVLDSPFGRLLQNACYGHGDICGLDVKELDRIAWRTVSWRLARQIGWPIEDRGR